MWINSLNKIPELFLTHQVTERKNNNNSTAKKTRTVNLLTEFRKPVIHAQISYFYKQSIHNPEVINKSTSVINIDLFFKKICTSLILCGWITITVVAQTTDIRLAEEYWSKGQKDKAYQTYRSIIKQEENLELVHQQYLAVLIDLGKFKEASDHMNRMLRRYPNNLNYKLDYGYVYSKSGELAKAEKLNTQLIAEISKDFTLLKQASDYWVAHEEFQYAANALQQARQTAGTQELYIMELANIYRMQGKQEEMVGEYLNYVTQSPGNLTYVKNLLQLLITKPDEQAKLQSVLLKRVQAEPNNETYADLLAWTQIQQKNFYGAFIQARAYDKRFGKGYPIKTMELAAIAANNNDVGTAIRCYEYVLKEYPKSEVYLSAKIGLLKMTEQKLKQRKILNKDSVQLLAGDYHKFYEENREQQFGIEARIIEARLKGLQLNQPDTAITILNALLQNPRLPVAIRSRIKIDLADYYLLNNEPWESALLYAQVEKTQKDSPIAYEAKLKNAKLSYYRGDFQLAEEHLNILKQATSREIANDALELSLRIKENIQADSTGSALKIYAAAELLLLQNREHDCIKVLTLLEKADGSTIVSAGEYPTLNNQKVFQVEKIKSDSVRIHVNGKLASASLLDDVYWLKADIYHRRGNYQDALEVLEKIIKDFSDDVLTDDASFLKAEIYEINLGDNEHAKNLYQNFLKDFPSSVYAAEARKRFRILRGDFLIDQPLN
jgi:tetratricopeptide (TPR) repeat protein